jgi:uncharacterized protein (DUF2141 family)
VIRGGGLFLALLISTAPVAAADLTITVTGIGSSSGQVRLALFNNPIDFPSGKSVVTRNLPAREGEMTVIFEGLTPGPYALALHHDANGNGKMDTSILGLPQEGYGFSNDAPVFLGAPPFDAAAVDLPAEGRSITARMVY